MKTKQIYKTQIEICKDIQGLPKNRRLWRCKARAPCALKNDFTKCSQRYRLSHFDVSNGIGVITYVLIKIII